MANKHIELGTYLKNFPEIYNEHVDEFDAQVEEFGRRIDDAISHLQSNDSDIINKFNLLRTELMNSIDKKIDEAIDEYISGGASGEGVSMDAVMTKVDASYLKKASAEDTYLSKLAASNTYALKSSLSKYAKIEDIPTLEGVLNTSDADSIYAKKSDLVGLASKNLLTTFAKKTDIPDVSEFITDADIENFVDRASLETKLSDYVKTVDTSDFVKKDEVPEITGYLTEAAAEELYLKKGTLPDFVTRSEISGFAKESDIPDITNLATKAELKRLVPQDGLFVILNDYVKSIELNNYASKYDIESLKSRVDEIENRPTPSIIDGETYLNVVGFEDDPENEGYSIAVIDDEYDITETDSDKYITRIYFDSEINKYVKRTELTDLVNRIKQIEEYIQSNPITPVEPDEPGESEGESEPGGDNPIVPPVEPDESESGESDPIVPPVEPEDSDNESESEPGEDEPFNPIHSDEIDDPIEVEVIDDELELDETQTGGSLNLLSLSEDVVNIDSRLYSTIESTNITVDNDKELIIL